jgi:hypothetical protein
VLFIEKATIKVGWSNGARYKKNILEKENVMNNRNRLLKKIIKDKAESTLFNSNPGRYQNITGTAGPVAIKQISKTQNALCQPHKKNSIIRYL